MAEKKRKSRCRHPKETTLVIWLGGDIPRYKWCRVCGAFWCWKTQANDKMGLGGWTMPNILQDGLCGE